MSRNLLIESVYSSLVTRRIGAVHDEAARLRTRFDAAAVNRPTAGGPALADGDTLVITTLDRLDRSSQNMLAFADELRGRGAGLRFLKLCGGDSTPQRPWAK